MSNYWKNKALWQKDEVYTGDTSGVFPNIREEIHRFLYGSRTETAKGFWIIHRKMDLTRESAHWDPENREVYRGYRWEYTDHLIRARYMTYPTGRSNETDILPGNFQNITHLHFVEWNTDMKKEDRILWIKNQDSVRKPTENSITLDLEYDIIRADRVLGDLGRVEYIRVESRQPSKTGNTDLNTLRLVN
jgi:hypothetical protein